MTHANPSLATELTELYRTGMTVSAISAFTGLTERAIVVRLCVGARIRSASHAALVDCDGALRVRWEFVSCRN